MTYIANLKSILDNNYKDYLVFRRYTNIPAETVVVAMFSMYIVPMNDDKFIEIIKIIKLGKNLGRNEKIHVGLPTLV